MLVAETETLFMFAARAASRQNDPVGARCGAVGRVRSLHRRNYAYQGGGRGANLHLIATLRDAVQQGLEPDLTLLLDAPPDVSFNRITARTPDHFEKEDRRFFERVRQQYLALATEHASRFRVVDAGRPLSAVQAAIATHLKALESDFRG